MLTNPSPEAHAGLDQIGKLPRWRDVDNLIEAELKAIFDRMLGTGAHADLDMLRGRALALKELQSAVRDAPKVLEKLAYRPSL